MSGLIEYGGAIRMDWIENMVWPQWAAILLTLGYVANLLDVTPGEAAKIMRSAGDHLTTETANGMKDEIQKSVSRKRLMWVVFLGLVVVTPGALWPKIALIVMSVPAVMRSSDIDDDYFEMLSNADEGTLRRASWLVLTGSIIAQAVKIALVVAITAAA